MRKTAKWSLRVTVVDHSPTDPWRRSMFNLPFEPPVVGKGVRTVSSSAAVADGKLLICESHDGKSWSLGGNAPNL